MVLGERAEECADLRIRVLYWQSKVEVDRKVELSYEIGGVI